jgi:hypothetical protein
MTPIAVVTVFAPRPEHPNWRDDYVPLLKLQRATANRFGHPHIVVTDGDLGRDFDELAVTLPANLMRAQLAGQIAWLSSAQAKDCATLLVDADCLVARSLSPLFEGAEDFDLGLTPRADPVAPINNGAMYIPRGSAEAVLPFFRAALERCAEHWGGDQEAISAIAAPVLEPGGRGERFGARVLFLSMRHYNVIPKAEGARHKSNPFVVHFKGATKAWADLYARRFIL